MSGLTCFMGIFGILILLAGFYLYTFKKKNAKNTLADVLLWRVPDINKMTNKEIKNVGKWTMIVSIIPFILAIVGLFVQD